VVINTSEHYQPYFRAFILHRGLQTGDIVTGHEYVLWNAQKWSEWGKLNNMPHNAPISSMQRDEFEKWLFETVLEGQLELSF
jgi:hypothetical protein